MQIKCIVSYLLFSISCYCAVAQSLLTPNPIIAEQIGVKQGLSQGMTNCIYQDKEGYLWIATKDGLNRYDGYNITTYRNNPNDPFSLPDNYCNYMLEDDNGNFWIGTNTKGLFLFDKTIERFYPAPFINSSKESQCILDLQYAEQKLFIKTWTNVLMFDVSQVSLKKNGAASCAKARPLFSYNQLQNNPRFILGKISIANYGIQWIPGQSLWVDCKDSIFQFRPNADFSAWSVTVYSPELLGLKIQRKWPCFFLAMPKDTGKVIIGIDNQISFYHLAKRKILYKRILPKITPAGNPVFFQANDGSISIVGDTTTIIFYPETKHFEWTHIKYLAKNGYSFRQYLIDNNGLQWFGSPGFGMAKRDTRKQGFKSYSTTYSGFVYSKMPVDVMPHIPQQWQETYECRSLFSIVLDKKGVYWAYLSKPEDFKSTLLSFDTKTGIVRQHRGLTDNHHYWSSIYNDPQDRLWIYSQRFGNKNTIARIDKSTGSAVAEYAIPDYQTPPVNFVSQIYRDENGMIWLATINGLYALNEKTRVWKHWKNIPDNHNSLSSDNLLSICPDPLMPDKYLWIGTEGAGINRMEKATGNCTHYDEKDGLPNNVAYCILSDSLQNLWISSNKGLSCFNPSQRTFRNFTDEDGLPGNEFNRYTALYMPNGELMFGGVDGFVIFNPRKVLQKDPPAPVVFTGLTIANKPVNWKQDSMVLQQPIGYAKTITLQPGQNIFTISFASLEFRNNAKKLYQFRLEGFDKDWSIPTNRNEATYTNLSPGTYTFFVKGANTDGVWNEKPINIDVVVLPYWNETWWFRSLIALLTIGGLYGFYRYRLHQAVKMEKLRNRIASDLHDEIGSTLSSISLYGESAKKLMGEHTVANTILSKISSNTTEMMEAMSDIVWAINSKNDKLDNLANRMRSFAVQIAEAKSIELHFMENENLPSMPLDMEQRKNMYLIFKEAINNAVKYAECKHLWISFSVNKNVLGMTIKDDGKGIDGFDNFEKSIHAIQPSNHFGGNGIENMRRRAAQIKGRIIISSQRGIGTTIEVFIPMKAS